MGIGVTCCKKSQNENYNALAGNETEITFPSYTSKYDKTFNLIEDKYNLLTRLQLVDYVNLLEKFSMETATWTGDEKDHKTNYSKSDSFWAEPLSSDEFQSFLENQICKHNDWKIEAGQNEETKSIFIDTMLELHKSLQLKLKQHYDIKDIQLTKANDLAIGMLFCVASNISKVKLVFDLFADESKKLRKSTEFDNFIWSWFLLASYSMLSARKKVGKNHNKVSEIRKDELNEIIQTCELKDNQELLSVFTKALFSDSNEVSYDYFKKRFEEQDKCLGWIFSSKGIRKKLEEHNV